MVKCGHTVKKSASGQAVFALDRCEPVLRAFGWCTTPTLVQIGYTKVRIRRDNAELRGMTR